MISHYSIIIVIPLKEQNAAPNSYTILLHAYIQYFLSSEQTK
jgi:hypothetical protein